MDLGDVRHQRQTDAGTFEATPLCTLHAMEAFEYPRQLALGNATARIPDRELHVITELGEAHLDLPRERKLERVGEQVQDELFPLQAIDVHGPRKGRAAHEQAQ